VCQNNSPIVFSTCAPFHRANRSINKPKGKKSKKGDGAAPAKKQRKKKDPSAPKKATSAFMYFSAAGRERVKRDNPGIAFGQVRVCVCVFV
jgi:hypothetical protein